MSRPSDIPQDVWDAATSPAHAVYNDAFLFDDVGGSDGMYLDSAITTTIIARAIMDERNRVTKIMSDFPEIVHHPAGPAYGAGFAAAVMQMRIAIRKGTS